MNLNMFYRVFVFVALFCVTITLAAQQEVGSLPVAIQFGKELGDFEAKQFAVVIKEWEEISSISDCEGCESLYNKVLRVLDARELFHGDLKMTLSKLTEQLDTGQVLLGRMDAQSLLLPLEDFVFSAARETGHIEELEHDFRALLGPGVYFRSDLKIIGSLMDRFVSFKTLGELNYLKGQLEDVLPKPVVISPAALNILYTGVENPVNVLAGTADPSTVTLIGPGVRKGEESGLWYVKPVEPGPVTLKVSGQTPSGGIIQGSAEFTARRVPNPKVYIAGRTDGVITKSDIATQTGISARNDNFLFEVSYEIKGFEIVYTPEYGSPVTKNTPGNKFSADQLALLQKTKSGDRLLFRVSIGMPDGSIQKVSPIYFVR
ncbi:MAG: hypothetical protein ACI959_001528 [Limisphaerales bacterium]|jgi:hypothetical protein